MRKIENVERNEWILFISGIVVSGLFAAFSADVYEAFYKEPEFFNEMYNEGLYTIAAIIALASCWGVGILYYLVIGDIFKCDTWYYWLLSVVFALLLAPTVTFYKVDSFMQERNLDFLIQERNFAIASIGVSFVLYLVVCLSLKGLSQDNSKIPF